MMRTKNSFIVALVAVAAAVALSLLGAAAPARAQSGATRPRRVVPVQPTPDPAASRAATADPATRPAGRTTAAAGAAAQGTTQHAFALLQQKQYDAAVKEAKQIAAADPKNAEAWKIAGFAELELKQYEEAAADLRRALELQRAAGAADPNTSAALIQAYLRAEQFEAALPLLVEATTRKGAAPDANLLYSRGLAEFKVNRPADAERSFAAAVKADPRHAYALYQLGYLAYNRKDMDAAINNLNRATLADAKIANAWTLLTYAYLNRAQAAGGTGPKADADYLSAVRASESLIKLSNDDASNALHGQALIRAKQYTRAALVLERLAAKPDADGTTLYLLGFAHSRAKSFPKAAAALERAAAKSTDNPEIFRELGYVYENLKQYAKALSAYERGLQLAPDDADFKESAERIRPFAK